MNVIWKAVFELQAQNTATIKSVGELANAAEKLTECVRILRDHVAMLEDRVQRLEADTARIGGFDG